MKGLSIFFLLALFIMPAADGVCGGSSYILIDTGKGEVLYDSRTGEEVTDPGTISAFKRQFDRGKKYEYVYDAQEENRYKEMVRKRKEQAAEKRAKSEAERIARRAGEGIEAEEPGGDADSSRRCRRVRVDGARPAAGAVGGTGVVRRGAADVRAPGAGDRPRGHRAAGGHAAGEGRARLRFETWRCARFPTRSGGPGRA